MLFAIRILIAGVIIGMTGIPLLFLLLLRPTHPNNAWYHAKIFNFIGRYIYLMKTNLEGLEYRDEPGGRIFVSNHQGNLDIIPCCEAISKGTVSLGKKSLVWIPLFGLLYYLSGNILIDRSDKKKSQASLDEIKYKLNEKKANLWIMPEGTRNPSKELLPFKRGAFSTAIAAGVPIVPVAIKRYSGTISLNNFRNEEFYVKYLPPVSTEGLSEKDVSELAEKVRGIITNEINSF